VYGVTSFRVGMGDVGVAEAIVLISFFRWKCLDDGLGFEVGSVGYTILGYFGGKFDFSFG